MNQQLEMQLSLFHSVSRALDNFKKIGKNNFTPAKIRSRMTSLKETWHQCQLGHAALLNLCSGAERKTTPYFQEGQLDAHEDIFQTALDYMADQLEILEPSVSPNRTTEQFSFSRSETSALSLQHLPPIQLPPFSGDVAEWETFRDRFTSLIIDNKDISDFSRMHFLASSLTGRARDTIAGISVTADNFKTAWDALEARYENKRKLIETHVASLYNLPSLTRESAADLHALRDQADRAKSALERLDRTPEELFNDILVYFVSQKLDPATKRAWKIKCCSDTANPLPTYDGLKKFLSSRAVALEEIAPAASAKTRIVKSHKVAAAKTKEIACSLCKGTHYLSKCPKFLSKSSIQRRELIKRTNRCYNCLSAKHTVSECTSTFTCRMCQQKHHTLLHNDSVSSSSATQATDQSGGTAPSGDSSTASQVTAMTSTTVAADPMPVLLATAEVTVRSRNRQTEAVRALIDQGSEVTFMSEKLAQLLRVTRTRTRTTISAVGGAFAGVCRHAASIIISPREKDKPEFRTLAFILPSLTKYAPRTETSVSNWSHLENIHLADSHPTGSRPIDIIIGADLYGDLIMSGVRKGPKGQPIAQQSHLGWLLSGPTMNRPFPRQEIRAFHCSLEREIRRFWEVEDLPHHATLSPAEKQCENHFRQTHTQAEDGRYIVRLPFKSQAPVDMGRSRAVALQRLNSLRRRLDPCPEMKKEYSDFLAEYESLKHMTKVEPPSLTISTAVYIPHHPVIRNSSSTTRLRVVFNASSVTSSGTSLNLHLHAGPKLQTDLTAVLLRWRTYRYIYSADIAKMYRQIWIDPRDRDYQRILWLNPENSDVQDYRLNTVTYGTVSAPFLALRVLNQLIKDEGDQFPLAVSILTDNIYVDDVLFGAHSITEIKIARAQLCDLLLRGGFTLRKWASNRAELLSDIPSDDHGLTCNRDLQIDESVNILGISWNPSIDAFQFRVDLLPEVPRTKWQVLSAIAKLFDPLGWASPTVIFAKMFMQTLWTLSLNWDDVLPPDERNHWETIYHSFINLNQITIDRWTGQTSDCARCELHGFADASTKAYAACVYLRTASPSGESTVRLLAGKSRVAPIKTISVPRLELSAALLLTRLITFIQSSLNLSSNPCFCWTDSTVTLTWIRAHPSKWKTFVANRVSEIQTLLPHANWRHVSTNDNPADCASRGLLGSELPSFDLWWHGPAWLRRDPIEWPATSDQLSTEADTDARCANVHIAHADESWGLATRFSSWAKLVRVTAY
ncbi:PREDICTED: uncharacterized protein LOC105569270, partial [Vollenhovia emeryi]|uniref:uncharacterized protein LOC105569270 n=1 Tax=Vollenhovia emeryi TaxID=411798 RepID=UPI0005F4F855